MTGTATWAAPAEHSLAEMKRDRGEDAAEAAETVEPPVKVDDAIISFERELDQMSESNRVKTGRHSRAATCCVLTPRYSEHASVPTSRSHATFERLVACAAQVSSWGLQEAGPRS